MDKATELLEISKRLKALKQEVRHFFVANIELRLNHEIIQEKQGEIHIRNQQLVEICRFLIDDRTP